MKHYVRKWHLITSAISGGPGAYTSLRGKQELPVRLGDIPHYDFSLLLSIQ